ncbi:MAG: hypothetical protein KatS3mg098_288 [Candidatus Parcubacteria bacterium]|nr:GNAT family N-acetyltransferase [Patescibacteria group bacterium]BCX16059.1 MAG: hypothetical protein KatS3mg098_288 [Candidatus Parcubacteria bacterium]
MPKISKISSCLRLVKLKKTIVDNKNDLEKLVNFVYSYFTKIEKKKISLERIKDGILKNLKNHRHVYFFILWDNYPIGMLHLFLGEKFTDLCLIYLEKEFRRKGLGSFVFNLLKNFLEENRLTKKPLCIEINKNNKASQRFFSKMGAKLESVIYFYQLSSKNNI